VKLSQPRALTGLRGDWSCKYFSPLSIRCRIDSLYVFWLKVQIAFELRIV